MESATHNELTRLSASQMARQIAQRRISPVELVNAHLQRIEELNPSLNAFVCLDAGAALSAARAAEERVMTGGELPPLFGVPISIKSCVDVQGLRCEAGTRLRAGYVASTDAPLVRRLKDAGAIVLGTTNVPEMLMAYETDNLLYGKTSNPWDLSRSSGGSSGGEAAAIAAGVSAGGIGSDGGGSIRVPAHFTGICGLKPTPGVVPGTGHFPECVGPWAMTGVVGPMARTVEDLRLLLRVIAGPDDGDPFAAPVVPHVRPLLAHVGPLLPPESSVRGARIALLETDAASADPATREAVASAARALEKAGAVVEPLTIDDFAAALRIWQMIFCSATEVAVTPVVEGREADLSPIFRDFLDYARQLPRLIAATLLDGLAERDRIRARVLAKIRPFRALLAPVSSAPAFKHGDGGWGAAHPANYIDTMRFSQFANVMGLPAASVPAAISPDGLPIGVQVIGAPYEEASVLDVAAAIEAASGMSNRVPMWASRAAQS